MTQAGFRPMTLRYASPERILGKTLATTTDVYSLGMVLYALVAGQTPDGIEGLSVPEYLARLEQEGLPPPSKLLLLIQPPEHKQAKHDKQLLADVDAITLKAIRFEPGARYAGADALSDDLMRALERRPVAARAGTLRYRLDRFLQRNRLPVFATAGIVLLLGLGLAGSVHEASVARAETRRAEDSIEKERALAHLLLFDYFSALKRIPASTAAQQTAVSNAIVYLDSLTPTHISPALQVDTIQAYTEMGALKGSPYEENLGDVPGAIVTLHKAVALSQQLLAQSPGSRDALLSYVAAERTLGQVSFGGGDAPNAVAHLTAALDASQKVLAMPGVTAVMTADAAGSADVLGDAYGLPTAGTMNDPAKAMERYAQAIELYREATAKDPSCVRCRRGIAIEDWKLGMAVDDKQRSIALFRDGLAVTASLPAAEQQTPRIRRANYVIGQNLGLVLVDVGQSSEGFAFLLSAREQMRATLAADPLDARARADLALLDSSLANSYDDLGRYAEEEEANRNFLANVEALLQRDPANSTWQFRRALGLARAGRLKLRAGERQEGDRLGEQALALVLPLARQPHAGVRMLALASESLVRFRPDSAPDAELAVQFAGRAIDATPHPQAEQYVTLAEALACAHSATEAAAAAQRAQAVLVVNPHSVSDRLLSQRILKLAPSDAAAAAKPPVR